MQVYAVLYSGEGNFLMGHKPDSGYFFHNSNGIGGKTYPDGVVLNGAGKSALPGGKLEGSDTVKGAQKEFQEECGAMISFSSSALIIDKETYPLRATDVWKPISTGYCAAFFKVDDKDLSEIAYIIQETNLLQARTVMVKIVSGEITDYATISSSYPYCPVDNELEKAEIWNLKTDAEQIAALGKDEDTDWYCAILDQLKKIIGK
jgi:ADP-ribose pyrophosphatase YjhB (NUDIX family)